MCGKECVSFRGLKRHTTLKHVQEEVTPKEQSKKKKKMLIAKDEFMNIVKNRADTCNEDLCLPEVTRKMFSSFDFTADDAVELWGVLRPVVEMFHRNAENYYANLYGLLQENLLPKKFGGEITLTNILLPEVGNKWLKCFTEMQKTTMQISTVYCKKIYYQKSLVVKLP